MFRGCYPGRRRIGPGCRQLLTLATHTAIQQQQQPRRPSNNNISMPWLYKF